MNTQSSNKTWIWIAIIVIVTVIGYFYFYGASAPAASPLVQSSSADSEAVGSQVLTLLNQIQSLNIDTSIFSDPGFLTLRDYSVAIPPENVGRANPFAPLPGFSSGAPAGVSAPASH
jgi:hypothetical protein